MKIKHVVAGLMVVSVLTVGSITAFAASDSTRDMFDALGNKIMTSMQVKGNEAESNIASEYAAGLSTEEKAAETVIGASDRDVQPAGADNAAETVIGASDRDVRPAGMDNTAGTMMKGEAQPAEHATLVK